MRRLLTLVVGGLLIAATAQAQLTPPNTDTSLAALNSVATIAVHGDTVVTVQVKGTWVGTITFLTSLDGNVGAASALNMTPSASVTPVSTATANGVWTAAVSGLNFVHVQMTAYTSGVAVVRFQTAYVTTSLSTGGGGSSDVAIHDAGNSAQHLSVNASGQALVNCANCSGSGASASDGSTVAVGSTSGAPAMGFYHSTIDTVADGKTGIVGMDSKRNLFAVIRDGAGNNRSANVSAAGLLQVDGSQVTQPVSNSGTFATQASQSGSWAVTSNIGTTGGLALDATLTARLPLGAAPADTEANGVTALSRIGSFGYLFNGTSWDRIRGDTTSGLWVNIKNSSLSVTGSGNFTVVQPTGTNLHMVCDSGCSSSTAPADASTFTPGTTSQSVVGGFFQTTATSNPLTTGQMGAFQVTANRALFVNLRNASGTELGTAGAPIRIDPTGTTTQPVSVTNGSTTVTEASTLTANQSTVALADAVLYGFDGVTDSRLRVRAGLIGSSDVGLVTRPFLPSDGTNTMPAMDAAARAGFVKVTDGTNTQPTMDAVGRAGFVKITDGTNTMPTGDASARSIHTTVDNAALAVTGTFWQATQPVSGTVAATESGTWTVQPGNTANTTPWLVKPPAATGVLQAALSSTAQAVSGSAAVLDSYYCYNPNASAAFVQFFNTTTPTVGTTTPIWSIAIPATSGANLSNVNVNFSTAIYVAATTTATGSTAPGSALNCNFGYR